jgi:hypothetical protein
LIPSRVRDFSHRLAQVPSYPPPEWVLEAVCWSHKAVLVELYLHSPVCLHGARRDIFIQKLLVYDCIIIVIICVSIVCQELSIFIQVFKLYGSTFGFVVAMNIFTKVVTLFSNWVDVNFV